jgi:peptidyl-tRNA hydrolase, PTH1 family
LYLIAGLGNPGSRYHNTRHNIGFMVVDKLAEHFKIESFEFEDNYLYAVSEYKEKQVVLLKPLTYMNASGKAVKEFYDKYEVSAENMLIVYDDANIDFGMLRLRPGGSDGGQNGIRSIIYEMETDAIPRLRVGIRNEEEFERNRELSEYSLADFVLSEFTDKENENVERIVTAAKDAVLSFIEMGAQETMNLYNRNVLE